MKKIIKVVVAILAVCLLLATCSDPAENSKPLSDGNESTSAATVQTEESETEMNRSEVSIEESVICDNEYVTITVKGMEESWIGLDIQLLVENKTDKNIAISGMDLVVNGVTMTGNIYIDVAAGKKANGAISLYSESLQIAGITEIAAVRTCDAHIVDTDTYATLGEVELRVVTSLGEAHQQDLDESGTLIYEFNGIQVIAKTMEEEFYGKSIILYVKNPGQRDITVQAENISVNGYTVDGWLYSLVCAETSRYCELDILETTLEENGITEIEELTFTISLIDPDSYATIAASEELRVVVGK